jgi:hypothetical protein
MVGLSDDTFDPLAHLEAVVHGLDGAGIPYCLVGAMALNRHGYRRFTEDIN